MSAGLALTLVAAISTHTDWRRFVKGAYLSFFGALLAATGAWITSRQAEASKAEQLKLSKQLNETSAELVAATKDSAAQLLAKQAEVITATEESAAKSDEIARLSKENAKLSQELVAYTTGGNSFFHLHVRDFGQPSNAALIRVIGKHPVRDTQLDIFDVTEQFAAVATSGKRFDLAASNKKDVNVGIVYPNHGDKILRVFPFESNPTRKDYAYFIHFTNAAGTFRQIVHFVKVAGTWRQAYVVEKVMDDDSVVNAVRYFDEGYPAVGPHIRKQ